MRSARLAPYDINPPISTKSRPVNIAGSRRPELSATTRWRSTKNIGVPSSNSASGRSRAMPENAAPRSALGMA